MKNMQELIDFMILSGVLKSAEIIEAFGQIDRKYFVPKEFGKQIYVDAPLPIGKNQTISQPSTGAFMLELLKPKKGDKILDIGSGSGWTTSLLCQLTGEKGTIIGLERVNELVDIGEKNLAQFNFGKHCCIKKRVISLVYQRSCLTRFWYLQVPMKFQKSYFLNLNLKVLL